MASKLRRPIIGYDGNYHSTFTKSNAKGVSILQLSSDLIN